jgi:hypothetical protein
MKHCPPSVEVLSLLAAALGAALGAQSAPAPAPRDVAKLPANSVPLEAAWPRFADDGEGRIWAGGAGYKAGFDRDGVCFVPFFGSDAPRNLPVEFQAERVRVAGKELALEHAAPQREGTRVSFARKGCVEFYDVELDGIEQQFRFDVLPERGELVVDVRVAAPEYGIEHDGEGFVFRSGDSSFRYGRAYAVDARGRSLALTTTRSANGFSITVPTAFVAEAALPLVIDPLIGNASSLRSSTRTMRATDLAFDASLGEYFVTYESVFSATDTDVFLVRADAAMQPIGSELTVDLSSASWDHARIAGLAAQDRFLVVAAVRNVGSTSTRIASRLVSGGATPSLGASVFLSAVQSPSDVSELNPDVGGAIESDLPRFAVVWESDFGSTDHDLFAVVVDENGALISAAPQVVATTSFLEHHPVISNCDGRGAAAARRWAVAFRRDVVENGTANLRVCFLDKDASQAIPSGSANYAVGPSVAVSTPAEWSVSSPTDPAQGRSVLIAARRQNNVTNRAEIALYAVSTGGNTFSTATIDSVGGFANWNLGAPAVDTDGCRFAIAFERLYAAAPLDRDQHVVTIAAGSAGLVVQDAASLATSFDDESGLALVAARSGGSTLPDYAATWIHTPSSGNRNVVGSRYRGTGSGVTQDRPTGCGGLTLAMSGIPALGQNVTMTLSGGSGSQGFLVGVPISVPIAICAGCTLGVDGNAFLEPGQIILQVPCDPSFVGGVLAFQGFAVGSGTCLGSIALSNTLDVVVN